MDIALISPSPKPFAVGGIEKLMLGLYSNMDELTNNRVELIKLPTAEGDFWELIGSYEQFYKLNLDHFDVVISLKYPAWMVKHRNHVVYMAHHLRGLFDTYHFMNLPNKMKRTKFQQVNEVLDYINNSNNLECENIDKLFHLLNQLKNVKDSIPDEYFIFPGPFIKEIVHFMDNWALHPTRIKSYNSISETVKKRKDYFPQNAEVNVIYPPTSLSGLDEGSYSYLLMVGRLDGAKRVELVVRAMKLVDTPNIKLLIAGTGPEEINLKSLAGIDNRIQFLGYINNERLVELYKNAMAVIYVPYDEDYGLVTIEAMKCGKPVITCEDSGGTTEFVQHEKNGLIAKPTPEGLAQEITKLVSKEGFAKQLGQLAKESVQNITWETCINSLTNADSKNTSRISVSNRKKVTVLSTYPVFPQKHGGQLRIYNLYKNLSKKYDVTIISFNDQQNRYEKRNGNLKEISISKTTQHQEEEWNIEKHIGIPITDIVMEKLSHLTPDFVDVAEQYLVESDILISSHPYLFHLIEPYSEDSNKTVIYDSHNVEFNLKSAMLPESKHAKKLLNDLFNLEKRACENSQMILACSEEDKKNLINLFNVTSDKIVIIPNGVNLEKNSFIDFDTRQIQKTKFNIENEKIVTFIGSWHKPNLEAVEEIFKMAPQLPTIKFIIMGGQCLAFQGRELPQNVTLAGIVEDDMKELIYSVTDVAINPMITGSGTNLKIAEYFAKGVPVISTEIGTRGYPVENKEHCIISDISDFGSNLINLFEDNGLRKRLSNNARNLVEGQFSWTNISGEFVSYLKGVEI